MKMPAIRCAIYTRKSSDEGLDQNFNSLDAQAEACAAYIASQRHEGWKLLPTRYDDGGISGGTLERPALQRLMSEVEAGRIDMVVVYKIDRLTRSLADFAKLVERFEAAGCSFVSVTQAFNTSSSMGRLTLNVLLSFAQFEREVTAERIRDKIAASKKKGLWMGGIPPLGYDPHPDPTRRELVVNEPEAAVVRQLFDLYLTHGCLNAVTHAADQMGLRSKQHLFSTGRSQGGNRMSRGQIQRILTNPVYRGLIRHKEKTYPGSHSAIIDEELWAEVQERLQSASVRRRGAKSGAPVEETAPLKGKMFDETGDHLTPTHTNRRGKRLRYYVSNRLISGGPDPSGWRLPARDFEAAMTGIIATHLEDQARRHAVLDLGDAVGTATASAQVAALAERIEKDGILSAASLVHQCRIASGEIRIDLDARAVAEAAKMPGADLDLSLLQIVQPLHCRRRGVEMKIVAGQRRPSPDATLIRALRNAHHWADRIRTGTSLSALARTEGISERYMARIIHLEGLSPRIQNSIVQGRQPVDLTLQTLLRTSLSLDWDTQERQLGISA
ncbi:DNA-invertase hin [Roseivivax sp. THAF40]|uniref:recombinase family protein n=1 Tax=Roseivivax sp. THAF40 TaxID=2587858 RepID=UPI0012688523|nr:recombinase family protein [Roseivivax sp. THAF40]QFT47417.1 DNA-invertase hin [Roseivivax sp. THAF40]